MMSYTIMSIDADSGFKRAFSNFFEYVLDHDGPFNMHTLTILNVDLIADNAGVSINERCEFNSYEHYLAFLLE